MARLLEEADLSLAAGHCQEAVSKYLQAAAKCPSCRPRIKDKLLIALSHVIDRLNLAQPSCLGRAASEISIDRNSGRELTSDQLLFSRISERMCSMFAGDADAMSMLGVKCLDESVFNQAEFFLRVALEADSDYLSAKENLRVLFDRTVNRWHFHMLNDVQRNSAYFKAIHNTVKSIPNCSVLDIGSGTGILSMMAKRSGAERVYACEMNDAMVRLSCDALAVNGLAGSITVIHNLSTMLSVPNSIPNRLDLVVTEIVDAGLLGEHIIPTLRHAWKELLIPCKEDQASNQKVPTGHVIPCGAVVHAIAIECPEIRRRSRLVVSEVGGIPVQTVVLEGSCKTSDNGSRLTNFGPDRSSFKTSSGKELSREPYTCERLSQIRGGYRPLTADRPVLEFDFTNPEIPLPESHVSLPVISTGQLDAIAVWFDLHLDSRNCFSTSPSWDISWEQAIFPMRQDVPVQAGDCVQLHASCTDTLLHMKVGGVSREVDGLKGEKLACSNSSNSEGGGGEEASLTVHSQQQVFSSPERVEMVLKLNGKLQTRAVGSDGVPVFYVERSELCRWNDRDYIESYRRSLAQALEAIKNGDLEESDSEVESSSSEMEEGEQPANCLLLDMTHGLSPFGLISAKEGADFVQIGRTRDNYKCLVELLAESNKLSDHVSFRYMDLQSMSHSQVVWDVVVCDMINPQGELRTGVFEELAYIRSTSFHSSSLIIPSHMTVHAALISSPALRANSQVLGTMPTLGFDVAQCINKYQVTHFTDLDLSSWPHQMLSEGHEVMKVDLNSITKKPLKIENRVAVEVKTGGTAVGVAYWFTLHLYNDITVSTYQPDVVGQKMKYCIIMHTHPSLSLSLTLSSPHTHTHTHTHASPHTHTNYLSLSYTHCSLQNTNHWHQSAFLLPEDVNLSVGQLVTLRTLLRDSHLDIAMVTE